MPFDALTMAALVLIPALPVAESDRLATPASARGRILQLGNGRDFGAPVSLAVLRPTPDAFPSDWETTTALA